VSVAELITKPLKSMERMRMRAWVVVASLTVCLGTWFLIERKPAIRSG